MITKDLYGDNPFYRACANGQDKVVEHLLNSPLCKDFIKQSTPFLNYTPLQVAKVNKHHNVVLMLLGKGQEALIYACQFGITDYVKKLLEEDKLSQEGIDSPDISTYNLLLFVAIDYKNEKIALMLLEAGACLHKSKSGCHPLYLAAERGCSKVVQWLLDPKNQSDTIQKSTFINETWGNLQWTPLICAIFKKQQEIAIMLLEAGACLRRNIDGRHPLFLAAENGCSKVVQWLLDPKNQSDTIQKSTFINEKWGNQQWTPLACATLYKQQEIALMLLEAGAEIEDNNSPLIFYYFSQKYDLSRKSDYTFDDAGNLLVKEAIISEKYFLKLEAGTNSEGKKTYILFNKALIPMRNIAFFSPSSKTTAIISVLECYNDYLHHRKIHLENFKSLAKVGRFFKDEVLLSSLYEYLKNKPYIENWKRHLLLNR